MSTFTIKDSYRIRKRVEMLALLEAHRVLNPTNTALKRSMKSLIREWCSHNLLYELHLFRSHTKDVDFEYPLKWYYSLMWAMLSIFYF